MLVLSLTGCHSTKPKEYSRISQTPQRDDYWVAEYQIWKARPVTAPRKPLRASVTPTWACIAKYESGTNWRYSDGTYEGAYNFTPGTWRSSKPPGYPDHAYDATPAQQTLVADRVLRSQGWGAWPVTSRKCGYR